MSPDCKKAFRSRNCRCSIVREPRCNTIMRDSSRRGGGCLAISASGSGQLYWLTLELIGASSTPKAFASQNHLPIRAKLHNMRLMQFPQALETALQTLERMRNESAHRPCATRSALDALNQIAPVRENLLEDHAPSATRKQNEGASSSKNDLGVDNAEPSKAGKIDKLAAVQARVSVCTKCPNLASSRTQTVFGVGNPDAEIMFIGEAPGADEDAQGEPFVGRAGQLLTKIIKAMGFA